ncbi:Ivy family c-type lysozyme inhibitor [Desulforegula conservatrix]|uniref:Ivy family c-type lysozyme inhibitor n=1 Tax=Desulforegula conservatrix TaxID=153026 RepID=UPI000408ABC3|nr:Ivy family c-type lysozyme inhibitor [Desulforegula conservatrix]
MGFLKDSKFKKAYFTALDIKKSSKWLTKLDGPSSPAKKINIDGEEFYSINSCQNHACDTDNIIILYSPTSGKLFGKLSENERIRLIGSPQGKVLEQIDKLYGDRFLKTSK